MHLYKVLSLLLNVKQRNHLSISANLFLSRSFHQKTRYIQTKRGLPLLISLNEAMSKSLKVNYEEGPLLHVDMEIAGTVRKMLRPIDETVDQFFGRIIANFQKLSKKKNKKLKTSENNSINLVENPSIDFYNASGEKLDTGLACLEALQTADTLVLNGTQYKVEYNLPSVAVLELTSIPMVGIPLFPKLLFNRATISCSKFSWLRSKEKRLNDEQKVEELKESLSDNDWEQISTNMVYTASDCDLGRLLKVRVQPGNSDSANSNHFDAVSGFVGEGPGVCLFDARHILTQHLCGHNSVRVVCYNILADCYAMTEMAEKELFPYCPSHIRDISYRIQLTIKELKGYHGDVICLQEVDSSVFQTSLVSAMSMQNYAGAFAAKLNAKEGPALFYNRSKFRLVSVENKIVQESLFNDDFNKVLSKKISKSHKLKNFVKRRGTCILIAVLQCTDNTDRYLVVANTHLYFHPSANHLRMIQMATILNILQNKITETQKLSDAKVSYMLTGDLNSRPTSGVIELIEKRHIPVTHADWFSDKNADFYDKVTDLNLYHDLNFSNASGRPKYTNYVANFQECLDYIFIDPTSLKVDQVIPPPPHELVTQHTALPSPISPSDHIAQIVDLTWKGGLPILISLNEAMSKSFKVNYEEGPLLHVDMEIAGTVRKEHLQVQKIGEFVARRGKNIYALLEGGNKTLEREGHDLSLLETEAVKSMSLIEAKQRRAELQKHRALMSFHESKNRRLRKIKSKKFHRILKKKKMKENVEENEGSTEQAMKMRAEERATLKHRMGSKWAKNRVLMAKHDEKTKLELQEQLKKHRELVEKKVEIKEIEIDDGICEENENFENEVFSMPDDISNPWLSKVEGNNNVMEIDKNDFGSENTSDLVDKNNRKITENGGIEIKSPEILELDPDGSLLSWLGEKDTTPPLSPILITNLDSPAIDKFRDAYKLLRTEGEKLEPEKPVEPEKIEDKVDTDPSKTFSIPTQVLEAVIESSDDERAMTIEQAFADDDVLAEFAEEKKKNIEDKQPKVEDLSLPGWGSWGGVGVRPRKKKKRRFRLNPIPPKPRSDKTLGHVIINEDRNVHIAKHQVSQVPFPFVDNGQFERTIARPIGATWNTPSAVKELTQPKVTTVRGAVIQPMHSDEVKTTDTQTKKAQLKMKRRESRNKSRLSKLKQLQ